MKFERPVDLKDFALRNAATDEPIPFQFSSVVHDGGEVKSATLNFFSDLPSGANRKFVLEAHSGAATPARQVSERHEGDSIILDSGVMRVRIPATQEVRGDAPGPILQVSRGGVWVGSSTFSISGDRITRITTKLVESGPLFIAYEIVYDSAAGSRYKATVQCNGGMDFVRFQENMESVLPGAHGIFESNWSGFNVTHRQAPNHPFPLPERILPYDEYNWERIDDRFLLNPVASPDGQLPFNLGIYQTWTAFHSDTSANFWDEKSNDALGVFIDKVVEWQDHEYASHTESETLQVRFHFRDGRFTWGWPVSRGSRSCCIAFYDHEKDKQAMRDLERAAEPVVKDGFTYNGARAYTSHTMFLQNRYGTLDLNCVKDWVLEYPDNARRPPVLFSTGQVSSGEELERRIMTSVFIGTLPLLGTRENGGMGAIPGRSISNFSPVPSRQIQAWWVDAFNRFDASMTERQRKRLTAIFLFIAYVDAGEDFMPLIPMLGGHPNFLADVKANPAAMSFLFPDHPMAAGWADLWQKCVELNTRYNTRPEVKAWDACGGRWTEDLGTYVWAFLRPSLRTEFLLRHYDGVERFLSPQLTEMAEWLVGTLTAPFEGEPKAIYDRIAAIDDGHEWGAVPPGTGRWRVHPPQGAHSERRIPPRSLWYFGTCLQRYAPLTAEHAMWAARPTNQDMESPLGAANAWDAMYKAPDHRGTNPHLRSRKFTGYGYVLRAAVDTAEEISIHLQQIDRGPNYRWGLAGEGGCGVIYYFANGKSYSTNGAEDVGDRADQDTDFCTNFGVYKNGSFRSIGMNVLDRPFYDLGVAQFAEIVSREGPTAYAAPEYLSRSVLLAGRDYFALYDSLMNQTLIHRLSWFVRPGEELPAIHLVRGAPHSKEYQRTEVRTDATSGVWFDGVGDSMAIVSHRQDLKVDATPFGCRITTPSSEDLVFRNPEPVQFEENGAVFHGTAGIIRIANDKTEFALFHGMRIGVRGISFSTDDTDLGIAGSFIEGQPPSGEFFATQDTIIRIHFPTLSGNTGFYIDGEMQSARRDEATLMIALMPGCHHWELTDRLPVPIAPQVLRSENFAGGARILLTPVASATRYRLEVSKDTGATWQPAGEAEEPVIECKGFADGEKIHVRAIGANHLYASEPGSEYPVYITNRAPEPPDGIHIELRDSSAAITWGEVLGVTEYRLYARSAGELEFHLVAHGLHREYIDRRPGIRSCNAIPGQAVSDGSVEIVEYCVTATNGNGESPKSRVVDTNPASWRNWDPRSGEPFRRVTSFPPDSPPSESEWPRYYPA